MTEMYLVQYNYGSYSDYTEINLFVTPNEEYAKKWVEDVEAQLKEADKIKYPEWTYRESKVGGGSRDIMSELKEYGEKRKAILTLLPQVADYYWRNEPITFNYFPIEIRQ